MVTNVLHHRGCSLASSTAGILQSRSRQPVQTCLLLRTFGFSASSRTFHSSRSRRQYAILKVCCSSRGEVNVLVVGNGGREHALSWKIAQSPLCGSLFCAPGNAGIAMEPKAEAVPTLKISNHKEVIAFCKLRDIGLVVVGPEAPLVDGLADSLNGANIKVFGPSAKAARLEGSKAFMKDLCRKYGIPTALYSKFRDPAAAKKFIEEIGAPIVVKTDGLAAGKGVIVAQTVEEAFRAVDDMLVRKQFGEAGAEVIVEEFLQGEEASFFALVDGETCLALASAQDHKAVGEGDTGPNTGGMGAYSPALLVNPEVEARIMQDIVIPTAAAMVAEGCPYRGVLFAGVMLNKGRPRLLEHNVRWGDPECQALMMRLKSDLLLLLLAACEGKLRETKVEWHPDSALTVVMAAKGYPGPYKKGSVIQGFEKVAGAKVFHAGTDLDAAGHVVATGGRVLGVTALGRDVLEAQRAAYDGVKAIQWDDAYFRRDIGWRAVERLRQGAAL